MTDPNAPQQPPLSENAQSYISDPAGIAPSPPPAYAPPPSYPAPAPYQPPATPQHYQPPMPPVVAPAALVRKQGAWGLWWVVLLSLGIYYFVWYARINRELAGVVSQPVPANGRWWSQLIPIYNLVGLACTAKRVNAAHAAVGSPTRVGVFTSWFWAPWWFASQTRYLQRRINILHDVLAGRSAR